MQRTFYKLAAVFAMTSVVLGAFGAHALKGYLSEQSLAGFQTATTYMMTHAIALFIVGNIYQQHKTKTLVWAGIFFIVGIVFFSGSIYVRMILLRWGVEKLLIVSLITPVGGMLFILGWLLVFLSIPKRTGQNEKLYKDED